MARDITNRQILLAMTQQLGVITDNMATKDDVYTIVKEQTKHMATKKDIANMATKDDLTNMATKKDIANMATKDDLTDLATKDDLTDLATKDDLTNLATKDDLDRVRVRLEDRIRSSRLANTRHHLETRDMLGDLHRRMA